MHSRFRQVFALIAALLLSSSLLAIGEFVPGHLYTIQNDTLVGWIKVQSDADLALGCLFCQTPKGPSQNFGLKELIGFQLDNEKRHFIKRTVEHLRSKQEVFLETVVTGDLSLYYWQDRKAGEVLYLSEKDDSTLIPLPYNQYEGHVGDEYTRRRQIIMSTNHRDTLLKYMPDRPDLLEDIARIKKPKLTNLTPLLAKYNNVIPPVLSQKIIPTVKKTFAFYVTPGLTYADFQKISSTKYDMYGGGTVSFDFPGTYDELVVVAGLYGRLFNGNPVFRNYNYQYKIPIGLEYRFPGRLLRPFFFFGADGFINRHYNRFILAPGVGLYVKIINHLALSLKYNINVDIYLDADKLQLVNNNFKTLGDSETLGLQFKF
jgi:hypothetical protein